MPNIRESGNTRTICEESSGNSVQSRSIGFLANSNRLEATRAGNEARKSVPFSQTPFLSLDCRREKSRVCLGFDPKENDDEGGGGDSRVMEIHRSFFEPAAARRENSILVSACQYVSGFCRFRAVGASFCCEIKVERIRRGIFVGHTSSRTARFETQNTLRGLRDTFTRQ